MRIIIINIRKLVNCLLTITLCTVLLVPVHAQVLTLQEVDAASFEAGAPLPSRPDQLPHSRVATGTLSIAHAWLAGPTSRYRHGVLGDRLEASRLVVETMSGEILSLELSEHRVFEDLEPRLADLNRDHREEVLVIESDLYKGASLAVYGVEEGRLVLLARTPFIGLSHRWLNPVGVGDFNGDGQKDIAIIVTPHIGGILNLYTYEEPEPRLYAELYDVSTHQMGSTELGLGRVVPLDGEDGLLLPEQSRQSLILFRWTDGEVREVSRVRLPAALVSSLYPSGEGRWRFKLRNGQVMEVMLK